MGLFSFIESAGRLLTGGHEHTDATQDESKPAPPPPPGEAILGELKRLGLNLGGAGVAVDGNTATLTGTAPDAETREKAILAAGNVAGIKQVDEQVQVGQAGGSAAAPAEPRLHTVVKGETLSGIAKAAYGDANRYGAIFEANKPMLTDPNKIYPGQVLRLPA